MSTATPTPLSKMKPDQAVKELSKKKSNKPCFDCGRSGPQSNVNLTVGTFVCSVCAGLLRSYMHKIKTINMADFSAAEVEELDKMGNKKAKKIWKAKMDENLKIEIDNIEQIKTIMQATYKDKKYYKDANEKKKKKAGEKKDKKKEGESDSDSDSDDEGDKKKKKQTKIKKKVAKEDGAGASKENTAAASGFASDPFATEKSPEKKAEKKADGIDFLSNMDFTEQAIPERRNSNAPGARLSFSSAFGPSNDGFDSNHKGGGSVFPEPSASLNGNSNGAIVSLRSADDPAVQFLLNQLKIAAKQFDLLPADVKAVIHTTLQVYEKSLQQAAKEGKDIKKVNNDVDHFLDLDAQVEDDSSGNPFDDDYQEVEPPAANNNIFGGMGGSANNIFGGVSSAPAPAPVSIPATVAVNAYGGQINASMPAAPIGGGMNPAAVFNQQQLSQQMQQQLIIQQRMQQQMQQQAAATAAAMMMAGQQQFYQQPVAVPGGVAAPQMMAAFQTPAATAQANLFNVPAAQPPQPQAAHPAAKNDIFAALNPF